MGEILTTSTIGPMAYAAVLEVSGDGPERPEAKRVLLFKTDNTEIPWPEGLTLAEALDGIHEIIKAVGDGRDA